MPDGVLKKLSKRPLANMGDDIQFGINWTKKSPNAPVPLIQKHQYCAYYDCGMGAFYHRKERIKAFWPEYEWHRWNERRLRADCDYKWITWLGPASSGKSTDAAILALEYWLQAPDRTAVIMASTTMPMLKRRIWSEVVKYHQKLANKGINGIGELIDSRTLIRWKAGDDKHGIFGVAVEEGPVDEVVNNLIGFHTERVVLFLDEMQGIEEAIMKATFNMSSNPVFRFRGMGNPDSLLNPLGRESEPVDGWDSVTRADTEQWETHGGPTKGRGICQFFDGRKSPADDSPEETKRLKWLVNKEWVAGILKGCRGNDNAPEYWQMAIGWPPPMGLESTVLDASIVETFRCRANPVWTETVTKSAALDPAFSGGDKAILQFLKRGKTTDDLGARWQIGFDDWVEVPINGDSTRPIHYQIVDFCKVECIKRGIPPSEFALDASGEGGGLASIFRQEWGNVVGIEAGGSPSELPIDETGKTAREAYDTRSSELCFSVREMAQSHGIKGLSEEACKQLSARRTFYRNGKWCVEPKTGSKGRTDEKGRPIRGFKQRLGYSPDHADACAVGVEHCRQKGVVPTVSGPGVVEQYRQWEKLVKQMSDLYSEEAYADYTYA
jgi:hypothetical protein